jgi:hypothetical protein
MSQLDPTFLTAMLADQGLSLSAARVTAAAATHGRMRPGLEQLRSLELSFLEPVIEPASALQWLETPPKGVS